MTKNELKNYIDLCKKGLTLAKNVQAKKDYHNPEQVSVGALHKESPGELWP